MPPHRVGQEEAKTFARGMFSRRDGDFERLLPIFDNVNIDSRYFCVPVEWFERDHGFPEKNALYVEHALDLSEKAARRALDRVGAGPEDVGAIFFVSTTGISTPSLDSKLIFRLGLSEHTRRVPIWGLGCSAGAAGLARASEHARLYPDKLVLLVAVELSGLTFQRGDRSKSNLISTSLFADGAAAVLLGNTGGPEVLGSYSTTWPDTEDVMGWDLVETGLKVQLSKSVPAIVQEKFRGNLEDACASLGLDFERRSNTSCSIPAAPRSSTPSRRCSASRPAGSTTSRDVLRDCGNMSSVTVLFILERFLESQRVRAGRPRRALRDGTGLLRRARVFQMLTVGQHLSFQVSGFRFQVFVGGAVGFLSAALPRCGCLSRCASAAVGARLLAAKREAVAGSGGGRAGERGTILRWWRFTLSGWFRRSSRGFCVGRRSLRGGLCRSRRSCSSSRCGTGRSSLWA